MMRSVVAVLAGTALWSVLWIGFGLGMQAAFPETIQPDRYLGHLPTLLGYLAASTAFSVIAGYVTALAAGKRPVGHAVAAGIVLVVLGIGFEASYWNLLPVWYHLVFLALLLPGNVVGGIMRANRMTGGG